MWGRSDMRGRMRPRGVLKSLSREESNLKDSSLLFARVRATTIPFQVLRHPDSPTLDKSGLGRRTQNPGDAVGGIADRSLGRTKTKRTATATRLVRQKRLAHGHTNRKRELRYSGAGVIDQVYCRDCHEPMRPKRNKARDQIDGWTCGCGRIWRRINGQRWESNR